MEYLPLFFQVHDRPCVVAGEGVAATRKTELLLRAGARVHVVSLAPDDTLRGLAEKGRVTLACKPLDADDFAGCAMAIIATEDAADAARGAAMAAGHTTIINVVDRPELCTCIVPAIVDRSPVVVAVSTAGAAPVLGRLLRARLEALLPARLGDLAALARSLRPAVAARLAGSARRRFWESVLQGPLAEMACQGRLEEARSGMLERLETHDMPDGGEVYVVAAPGDGDPETLTLRGLRLLQQADVVVHDADLPPALLDLIRRDADRSPIDRRTPAAEVAAALAALAAQGKRVGWLSLAAGAGGDADAVARHMAAAGVPCQRSS
jgi:uroporphyrin-III C-methyltransferase/precorrin-2 dehydrogenase/sirohydrochlorin ferrochelatase